MSEPGVVIVGGGVSGLAAAYFLGQRGFRSILIEKSGRFGGLIQTDRIQGCALEAGPDSYLAAKPGVTELASALPKLSEQIIGSNDEARRIFVVRAGKLVPMPQGMVMMVPGEWAPALRSPLFGARTKVRLISETLSRPRSRGADLSVAQFITEHFGRELLDRIAEPLLAGVYGGDSGALSARSVLPRFAEYERKYGSLIRAVRRERKASKKTGSIFRSFRDGMDTLTAALAGAARVHTTVVHAEATRVEHPAKWRVRVKGQWIEAENLVLACPAYIAGALLEGCVPRAAADLCAIPYSSAILATFVYPRPQLNHPLNGFGFLVPRSERRTISAATWVSTKFPARVPPGLAAVRAFIVAQQAGELLGAADEHVLERVQSDLSRLMGAVSPPLFSTLHRWPGSMPQYEVGHEQRRARIACAIKDQPGLHVIGNAYEGVGIPDCIRMAKETAKQIGAGTGKNADP